MADTYPFFIFGLRDVDQIISKVMILNNDLPELPSGVRVRMMGHNDQAIARSRAAQVRDIIHASLVGKVLDTSAEGTYAFFYPTEELLFEARLRC